jgi:hypothetical protein
MPQANGNCGAAQNYRTRAQRSANVAGSYYSFAEVLRRFSYG